MLSNAISVTRFGEISPLWQKIKNLEQTFVVYLVFGKKFTFSGMFLVLILLLQMAKYWKII